LPDITPLHVGTTGYLAQVCRKLKIAEMVNRLVQWDEKQWKCWQPGLLSVPLVINILIARRPLHRFGRPTHTWIWLCSSTGPPSWGNHRYPSSIGNSATLA